MCTFGNPGKLRDVCVWAALDGIKKRNSCSIELFAHVLAVHPTGRKTKPYLASLCKVHTNYMRFAMQIFGKRVAFFYSHFLAIAVLLCLHFELLRKNLLVGGKEDYIPATEKFRASLYVGAASEKQRRDINVILSFFEFFCFFFVAPKVGT